MKVIADLCIVPIGKDISVSEPIARAIDRIDAAGLEYSTHAYGTNVEGEYDVVFATLKQCLEDIHAMGWPRITCTIKLGTRTDRDQSMQDKLDSVAAKRSSS